MTRILLFLIERLTPRFNREWVAGDTLEEFGRIQEASGRRAARRWLWSELGRVARHAPGHWMAVRGRARDRVRAGGDGWFSSIRQDLKYSVRSLRRSPGFAAIAIATLALGIGANTAMFAVVNGVLLKPLPFAHPDRLMLVHLLAPDFEAPGTLREGVWSQPKYWTFSEHQQVFDAAALYGNATFTLTGEGPSTSLRASAPERVPGEVITDQYPAVLGISPTLGRAFTSDEANRVGAAPVVILGHRLWTLRFGADPAVLGRRVGLSDTPYTVVGVMPPGFRGLTGNADFWVPLGVAAPDSFQWAQGHSYYLVARRKAEVSEASTMAAVRVLGRQISATHLDTDQKDPVNAWSATARSLDRSRADSDVRRAALVLFGAVGCVLLIACVNLTNLVSARALSRRREVAVRVAIGAGRARIVRQFVVDGLVLGASGAVAGIFLAWALLRAVAMLLPEANVFFGSPIAPGLPRMLGAAGLTRIGTSMISLDATALLFTLGVAMLTAIGVSVVPALQAPARRPIDALRTGGRSSTDRGLHRLSVRSTLVTAQLALALVLLAGAGLMVRSGFQLQQTPIGINPARVLSATVSLPGRRYSAETGAALYAQLAERLRALPDVESVGLGNCLPVSGGCNSTSLQVLPHAGPRQREQEPLVGVYWASPEYFSTLGIRLVDGRNFSQDDRPGRPNVVLVNEAAARVIAPNGSAIGKMIRIGQGFGDAAEVVGIVSDVRYDMIESAAMPDVYVPFAQSYRGSIRVFVRGREDAARVAPMLARELRALDAQLPLSGVKTLDQQVGDAMWRTRVSAWILSAFATLALLLTAVGIFGVMAQTVLQRTAEIGIRMALGAQRSDVLSLVLGRAALLTGIGLAAGTGGALLAGPAIASFLYGVPPGDPITLVSVAALLGLVALVACYIPARRATRVDAVVALRAE